MIAKMTRLQAQNLQVYERSMKKYLYIIALLLGFPLRAYLQPVPSPEENIPYLMTFGPEAPTSWGDDDYTLIFFFFIPKEYMDPFYIRVFDPEVGGDHDEINGVFNTRMKYDIYGGTGCYSDDDAKGVGPVGNYRSGNLLASKIFGQDPAYDNTWYTFGPFNPAEGEFISDFQGNIFKIIVQGISGDDGNMYRFYLSSLPNDNKPIEGANAFTYKYSFRLWNNPNNVSHIYPYVDEGTTSIQQSNFDWDDDGEIRTVSVERNSQLNVVSGEDVWISSQFNILPGEIGTSLDFQFIKRKEPTVVRNNNVVIIIRNQYGEAMPFYSAPIGGVPRYRYRIAVQPKDK